MTKRREFLAANAGVRVPMPAFLLLMHPRKDGDPAAGYGLTVTKKIGGAVERNRIKRRFRAIIHTIMPELATSGADHVLIGRGDALTMDHRQLLADMTKALGKAKRRLSERDAAEPGARGSERLAKP